MNISQILDLPREERSRWLRAIPLTREYVFGCLEEDAIRFIRRTIVRCGGTWREEYCPPGLAVVATFRTPAGMRAATLALIHWQNESLRTRYDQGEMAAAWWGEPIENLMIDETFAHFSAVPALSFEIVNMITIGEIKTRRPNHPIRG